MLLPLVGLLVGVLAGLVLNVNVSFEFSRYSAVAILAALDSVLGAVRAELDGVYDNRIFISGFLVNAIVAVLLTFIGDRLSLDLYLVALDQLRVPDLQQRGTHPASLHLAARNDRQVEREAVLVGIDVGTSKVCALIGEVSRDGRLTIMGHGTVPASGLKKGVVVNIDQTVRSIADAVERAERLSGWKIDRAFVGVGGQHVESLNSTGQVAVTAHHREVTREDINRAIEVARAVSIPTNRDVLHVERRGFTVDGQEGVKDPLGMSALRLEVEAHIVSASATAVQNLTKCVALAGVKIDELVVNALARRRPCSPRPRRSWASRSRTSAPGPSTSRCSRTARRSTPRCCRSAATTSPTTWRSASRRRSRSPRSSRSATARATCATSRTRRSACRVLGDDAGRTVSREELCRIIEARMRETFETAPDRDDPQRPSACCRPGSS